MAYVVDVEEPWLGTEDISSYNAEGLAELQGVTLEQWLELFREATAEKGGTILYEGDHARRPAWLEERFRAAKK